MELVAHRAMSRAAGHAGACGNRSGQCHWEPRCFHGRWRDLRRSGGRWACCLLSGPALDHGGCGPASLFPRGPLRPGVVTVMNQVSRPGSSMPAAQRPSIATAMKPAFRQATHSCWLSVAALPGLGDSGEAEGIEHRHLVAMGATMFVMG